MTEKIVALRPGTMPWKPLLHQILERDGVEAVMLAVRVDGCWQTCWSNDTLGGLAMGAMKLFRDVSDALEE